VVVLRQFLRWFPNAALKRPQALRASVMQPMYHPRSVHRSGCYITVPMTPPSALQGGVAVPGVRFRIVKEVDTLAKLGKRGEFVVKSVQCAPILLGETGSVSASLVYNLKLV